MQGPDDPKKPYLTSPAEVEQGSDDNTGADNIEEATEPIPSAEVAQQPAAEPVQQATEPIPSAEVEQGSDDNTGADNIEEAIEPIPPAEVAQQPAAEPVQQATEPIPSVEGASPSKGLSPFKEFTDGFTRVFRSALRRKTKPQPEDEPIPSAEVAQQPAAEPVQQATEPIPSAEVAQQPAAEPVQQATEPIPSAEVAQQPAAEVAPTVKTTSDFRGFLRRAVQRLDAALPGESTEKTKQKLQKTQEMSELFQDTRLLGLLQLEIEGVLGLTGVSLFPPTSPKDKNKIGLRVPLLDAYSTLFPKASQLAEEGPEWNETECYLSFLDLRQLHQWLGAVSAPTLEESELIWGIIKNATGETPAVERGSPTRRTLEEQSTSSGSNGIPGVRSEVVFKLTGLSQDGVQKLIGFASGIDPTRFCLPNRHILVEQTGTEECALRLLNFPGGGRLLLHALRGLECLSVELTAPFGDFCNRLSALTAETTGSPAQRPRMHFDPYTQASYISIPEAALNSPWVRYWVTRQSFAIHSSTHEQGRSLPSVRQSCTRYSPQATGGDVLLELPGNCQQLYSGFEEAMIVRARSNAICGLVAGATVAFEENCVLVRTQLTCPQRYMDLVLGLECVRDISRTLIIEEAGGGLKRVCVNPECQTAYGPEIAAALKGALNFSKNLQAVVQYIHDILPLDVPYEELEKGLMLQLDPNFIEHDGVTTPALHISWQTLCLQYGHRLSVRSSASGQSIHCFDTGLAIEAPLLEGPTSVISSAIQAMRSQIELIAEQVEKIPVTALEPEQTQKTTGSGILAAFRKRFTQQSGSTVGAPASKGASGGSGFFSFFKSTDKEKKPVKRKMSTTAKLKGCFIAAGAAIVIAGIVYTLLDNVSKLRDLPNWLKIVGSMLTGVSIALVGHCAVTQCMEKRLERE
ncbi:hypothetical protein NHE_0422 [Neorickettsia helminthoeca str. Oregon]|uniref:Uncharacterized protein n=1 Tax=Neorickettsia helminthoeca str. Oregon TaxID=1286528 RepID=X5GWC2_9RICK|nr:hypothetical protein [Neorickettsia helminthoeca]AHX11367.1 hypothetical protein NHE_0422 [Neorickettsia helminthoeca str. Oregon]